MRNLQELDDVVLIDMLAQYTQRFTRLFRNFSENDLVLPILQSSNP